VRILMVSTTAIGDSVMATPFVRAVRQKYADAHISMFAHVKRLAVFEGNPHINEIIPYYGKGKKLLRTLRTLRKKAFDLAVVLHANDPDIVPLVRWTGAPQRVGWNESKWSHLFTHSIRRTNPPEHFLVHKKRLLESIGIPVEDLRTEIFFSPEDEVPFQQNVTPWLKQNSHYQGYMTIHAFGTNSLKWWPLENFFRLADYVLKNHGWAAVFVGDDPSLEVVKRHPSFDPTKHYVAQKCGIRASANIIKKSWRMVTTDSGPMHLAVAVQCPSLCLFGPTKPSMHGPYFDKDRHIVVHRDPLAALTVAEVIDVWNIMHKKRPVEA
jgi:ADP-heptose:LPS heptosyltransferase